MNKGLPSKFSRRNFLLGISAGGAAAAAALAATSPPTPNARTGAVTGSKGYRVTDHIRRYYRTVKV